MDDLRDTQRDMQKADPLSRFFDRHSIHTNPFGANQSADRAYRRAERIAAALFLATNHVPSSESIRASIRAGALKILEDILSLRDEMRVPDSRHVATCRASIRNLISLVRMLAVSGSLSAQNTNVLIEALDELGTFLGTSQNSALSETTSLSREDFLDIQKPSIKDIKDTRSIRDKPIIKDRLVVSDTSVNVGGLSVRKQSILQILRRGGELGIRDISSNLPEYSEKMIQRDLAELVVEKHVKKAGFKRWSRYSLVV